MPKIKRKVEMTLPELIEWAWENNVKEKAFYSNVDDGFVYFDMVQTVSVEQSIAENETFTVEIEEEITEDTVFKHLYEFTKGKFFHNYEDISISKRKDELSKEFWIRKDGTMTLIWKDGAMVDDWTSFKRILQIAIRPLV